MIRLLLVDDQLMLRMGFRMVLEAQDDMTVVGEAGNGAEAVTTVADVRPDVVLMDVRMPLLDGAEATRRIVATHPDVRVLILTTFDLDEYVVAGLRAGASGFLLEDVPPPDSCPPSVSWRRGMPSLRRPSRAGFSSGSSVAHLRRWRRGTRASGR